MRGGLQLDSALFGCAVARSCCRAGREEIVERCEGRGSGSEVGGVDVFLEPAQLLGPGDRHDDHGGDHHDLHLRLQQRADPRRRACVLCDGARRLIIQSIKPFSIKVEIDFPSPIGVMAPEIVKQVVASVSIIFWNIFAASDNRLALNPVDP